MNGNTKLKLQGGITGGVIVLILSFASYCYGYGVLNSKVSALENKTDCIKEIHKDIATIKNDIKWIKNETHKANK